MNAMTLFLLVTLPPGGVEEKPPVVRQIKLTIGATIPLQMTTKKPITSVFCERPTVARVSPKLDDQTTVLVTGVAPGATRIWLTSEDGETEMVELGRRAAVK